RGKGLAAFVVEAAPYRAAAGTGIGGRLTCQHRPPQAIVEGLVHARAGALAATPVAGGDTVLGAGDALIGNAGGRPADDIAAGRRDRLDSAHRIVGVVGAVADRIGDALDLAAI